MATKNVTGVEWRVTEVPSKTPYEPEIVKEQTSAATCHTSLVTA